MLIRILSDLHLEASPTYRPEKHPSDKDTTLILAGDICEIERVALLNGFLLEMSQQFKNVLYVAGNHEYYNGHITSSAQKLEEYISYFDNVFFLDNKSIVLNGIKFIGTTLWTDIDKGNPLSKLVVGKNMNDYYAIHIGNRNITPDDTIKMFHENVKFLTSELESSDGKTVVITHHAPSFMSIHEQYRNNELNGAYASDLSDLILKYSPDIMIHGHMHNGFDYMLGDTRIVCNPKGYPRSSRTVNGKKIKRYENEIFDDNFVITL